MSKRLKGNGTRLFGERDGFLLSEAILALAVTIMTIFILQNCLALMKNVRHFDTSSEIRMHVIQEQLTEYFRGQVIAEKDIQDTKLKFTYVHPKFHNSRKKTLLHYQEGSWNVLRLEDEHGGFEPILKDVYAVNFQRVGELLKIRVKLMNHNVTEMYIDGIYFQ